MNREVFYPPIGIAHITNDISDLIKYKLNDQCKIIINTSAQPNSSPHLGTITTIMCSFALAKHLKETLNIETEVLFDELENSPAKIYEINDDLYYKDLKHTLDENGEDLASIYMQRFKKILDKIMMLSQVNYNIRTYNEFQENYFVRDSVIKILNDKEYFTKLLFPSSNDLHIRTICPYCYLGKKRIKKLVEFHNLEGVELIEECPYHGEYNTIIRNNNDSYIDINTQFRDLTKGFSFIEEDKKNNILTIMLDGGDWSGIWAQRIYTEGMVRLGYNEFPIRLFSPIILDWSGAKFSKSLYLKSDAYKSINQAFINYDNFIETYGESGIEKLWYEVFSWIKEPKKFFRDYSVDYFENVFGGGGYAKTRTR